jgi:hypothetical protein
MSGAGNLEKRDSRMYIRTVERERGVLAMTITLPLQPQEKLGSWQWPARAAFPPPI